MKRIRPLLIARVSAALLCLVPVTMAAQSTPASPPAEASRPVTVQQPADPGDSAGAEAGSQSGATSATVDIDDGPVSEQDDGPIFVRTRPVVRVGQDLVIDAGERVREVVVVFGSATINGRVDRDVVVVLGTVHLGPGAEIGQSLVSVGSATTVEPGASVGRDLVVVGGGLDAPAGFSARGEHVVIGTAGITRGVRAFVPWLTSGLMLGRLIVPGLPWMWVVVAIFFLLYLALNLLFDPPIRVVTSTLARRPLSAFLVGLLVLLLTGPVAVILAVSVIGIAVMPFLVCALVIAALLGKVAVSRWVGSTFVPEGDPSSRALATRSFAIGSAVILLTYMVPVLGILVWSVTGVFGLGAATMAVTSGLRRENPKRRAAAPVVVNVPSSQPVEPSVGPSFGAGPVSSAPFVAASAPSVASDPAGSAGSPGAASGATWEGMPPPPVPPAPPVAPLPPGIGGAGAAATPTYLGAFPRADFIDRAAAFALDFLLILIVCLMLDIRGTGPGFFLQMLLAYHVAAWTWKSTTVGGIICQLRVVRVDGGELRFVDALVRGLSSVFSLAVVGLGCFWILKDPEKQSWHDKIAGTYVVKVPRHYPV